MAPRGCAFCAMYATKIKFAPAPSAVSEKFCDRIASLGGNGHFGILHSNTISHLQEEEGRNRGKEEEGREEMRKRIEEG